MSSRFLVIITVCSFIAAFVFSIAFIRKEKYGCGMQIALLLPFVLVSSIVIVIVLYNAISLLWIYGES